eukprot:6209942-Amphidinium_carterae.2
MGRPKLHDATCVSTWCGAFAHPSHEVGPLAAFKQFVADRLAGDYDKEAKPIIGAIVPFSPCGVQAIADLINSKIDSNKVMMFSFSTCPFCLRAKTLLQEKYGVEVEVRAVHH